MEWECWHGFQEHSERNAKRTKSKHTSVYDRITVGSIPRIRSPFLHTTLRQKWGGGVCSNIHSHKTAFLAIFNTCEVDHQDETAFWKNGSFDECVLQEISGTCVHTRASK